MPPSAEVVRVYQSRLETLRNRTSAGLVAAWDELADYRDEDVESFITRTAPIIGGAKTATVATSAAFFALATGTRPAPVNATAVPTAPHIDHPFLSMRHALAEGRPYSEALAAGRSQAEAVGFDFVQSTSRQTGDYVARASGERVRWQRVPGGSACDWCHAVAGETYFSAESADFGHDRCDCVAVPA